MDVFKIPSCVRGHHVYKNIWTPQVGKELECIRENNDKDWYAVAAMKNNVVVGHVPRIISAACSLFLQRNGRITCIITGH